MGEKMRQVYKKITLFVSCAECLVDYAKVSDKIKSAMSRDVIVDGRNIFSPVAVTKAGLTYYGIGQ